MTVVLAASNATSLRVALAAHPRTATVEAEFGNDVVEGSVLTRAHHAPEWAHNPSPCTHPNETPTGVDVMRLGAIGLSHIDLDSVGGTLALLGTKPGPERFWALAGAVDVRGPHRLAECVTLTEATDADVRALRAYWAWARADAGRVMLPRDGSAVDVTAAVDLHRRTLVAIFEGDVGLLAQGEAMRTLEAALNAGSFVNEVGGVIARVSPDFVNHLYAVPTRGTVGKAVVAFNTRTGSVTVSFADAPQGDGARGIVQALWGPTAGGHAGIAGSPRDRRMTLKDFVDAVRSTQAVVGA